MNQKFKVSIIGYGVVGKTMHTLFPDALIYNGQRNPVGNLSYTDINKTGVAFVCVPTPTKSNGQCDTSIVEEVVAKLKTSLIIIRSTIIPGTTDRLKKKYKKHIVFCPWRGKK